MRSKAEMPGTALPFWNAVNAEFSVSFPTWFPVTILIPTITAVTDTIMNEHQKGMNPVWSHAFLLIAYRHACRYY